MTTSTTAALNSPVPATAAIQSRGVIVLAYLGLLIAVSIYGFWRAFIPGDPLKLALAQLSFLLALFALTLTWKPVRALRAGFHPDVLRRRRVVHSLVREPGPNAAVAPWRQGDALADQRVRSRDRRRVVLG